ncbi:MAG: FeoB-associated Cys-rich membrane protein [Clostridiales bacterium]|nr:FeoB-associated Cys-rich membrane protein [Clostridiales bacterium]
MGDLLVLAILLIIVALIIRSMIRDKKAGRSPLCGGDCKECGGICHQVPTKEDTKNSR